MRNVLKAMVMFLIVASLAGCMTDYDRINRGSDFRPYVREEGIQSNASRDLWRQREQMIRDGRLDP